MGQQNKRKKANQRKAKVRRVTKAGHWLSIFKECKHTRRQKMSHAIAIMPSATRKTRKRRWRRRKRWGRMSDDGGVSTK